MNYDDKPMWNDPAESSALRRLLRAGRDAVSDYNVERGVVQHLANLQAGVPLPEWAAGLAAAKTATVPLAAWLAVPLLAASSLIGVWWSNQQADTRRPVVHGAPMASLQGSEPAAELALAAAEEPAAVERAHSVRAHLRVSEALEHAEARAAVPSTVSRSSNRSTVVRRAQPENAGIVPAVSAPETHAANMPGRRAESASEQRTDSVATRAAAPSAQATLAIAPSRAEPEAAAVQAEPEEREPEATKQAQTERPARPAAKPAPVPIADESLLEREMQMLAVTQRVLNEDPARALRLARQGEHEFPGSMFSAERKQLALLALVGLGRVDEARRMGRTFLAAYPNAPWSARLRTALATGRLPAP